jgi:hypothetical protein
MPGGDGAKIVYLVQAWHWRVRDDDTVEALAGDPRQDVRPHPYREGEWQLVTYHRGPDEGGLPVRAFRDYARAEAFRREREQARREVTNPFRYGWGMDSRTSLDDGRLRDWLLDAGLEPPGQEGEVVPEKVRSAWRSWWQRQRGRLGAEGLKEVAGALNNALAGRGHADGPSDLAWLDDRLGRMDELTPMQRANFHVMLIGTPVKDYPSGDGEHDHYAVENKWRDWWDQHREAMSDWQRRQVWEALDKVRFFEVVELEEP